MAALLFVTIATGLGLLISAFTHSQIAAIYATAIATVIPSMNFSGMTKPVSSMEGGARFFGEIFPAAHFITICRGSFSKALTYPDLETPLLSLALAVPVILGLSVLLLKKQEQ